MKRKIADFILKEIKDPRIGFVSITSVELSKDLSTAKVGISVLGEPRDIRKSFEGLNSATGYIQHHLDKEISIRHVPRIEFQLDSSLSEGVRMVNLINSLNDSEEQNYEGTES